MQTIPEASRRFYRMTVAIVGPCGAFHGFGAGAGDDACDADRARSGRAPLAPIIARIRAGEFTPAER
jgi:hypothetical protein